MGNQLQHEWQAMSSAPFLTIGALVVIAIAIWTVLHFLYRHRIDGLKDELERERAEIARLRNRTPEPALKAPAASNPVPVVRPPQKKKSAPAKTKPDTTIQQGERIILGENITPSYLMSLYRTQTETQANRAAEPYIGKWVRLSGTVYNIGENPSPYLALTIKLPTDAPYPDQIASIHFYFEHEERLAILHKGDAVTVQGRLERISGMSVVLADSELVDPI